ncbi:MAG: hypothetical protein DWQ35_05490 [Planctomycetota bacterium]|nr:MAG: hypothetical protein DWQ35_05490 [Planctomycetota bacterium]REK25285.1 MAG: hypothetical protein DWQ42_11835 [Planctomycetota bacterium]REK37985.1 MAG: hypothetical protein DWQ46_21260 [Planctomycetota bacterium]
MFAALPEPTIDRSAARVSLPPASPLRATSGREPLLKARALFRRRGRGALPLVLASVAVVGGLAFALFALGNWHAPPEDRDGIIVYCAAGVRPAVAPVAEAFEKELGTQVEIRSGSSGALEAQIRASVGLRPGDLYIPAAADPFVERNRLGSAVAAASGKTPFLKEVLPLARFRLVLAVTPGKEDRISEFADLADQDVAVLIANDEAAVGKKTKEVLTAAGVWDTIRGKARQLQTVTELAGAIKLGTNADAGFMWDATARQFGLTIVELPELAGEPSTISAAVLADAANPTGALRFARYLAAPDKGQASFRELHYETVAGDPWAEVPEVVLYSGSVNRPAIAETIVEFEAREGCRVIPTYDGCGALVATMRAGQKPDAYFACDISFMAMVEDEFDEKLDLSNTEMVILVRKGNPRNIRSLEDLAGDDMAVGLADEKLSALGRLTVNLLDEHGLREPVVKNRKASSPSAHYLVIQMAQSEKLDAAIVYRANCAEVREQLDIVAIDHPRANAKQPFAVHHEAQYPQLTQRLRDALTSEESRARFENSGFRWNLGANVE